MLATLLLAVYSIARENGGVSQIPLGGKMSDSSSDSGNEMGENAEMEKVSETMNINHLASDLT